MCSVHLDGVKHLAELLDDQLVLLIDLLGFSELMSRDNSPMQQHVLSLLQNIASMRSDFDLKATATEDWGSVHTIQPSVSTFSDHIVMSVSFDRIGKEDDNLKTFRPFIALSTLYPLVATVATAALRLGFLIRGGMAYGKLYHTGGVVFGPALIDAVALESRSAVYPRIVLSEPAVDIFARVRTDQLVRDFDGAMCLNFYQECLSGKMLSQGKPNPNWFSNVCKLLQKNLRELSGARRAKWFYFAGKLAGASKDMSADDLMKLHINPSELPQLD
jgi:hypothetical protein